MSGFFGWFLAIVLVLAIFNAERLPELRQLLEQKFKTSLDAAKEGSKMAKDKIKQVKTDIETKKAAAPEEPEPEENTPEEIEQEMKFMENYIKDGEKSKGKKEVKEEPKEEKVEEVKEEKPVEDAPIDLEHRY